VVKNPSKTVII